MHCKDNGHFIKNCKLLSAVSHTINVVTAETEKKATEEEKNSEKSSF
jgi:hypothetical protein